MKYNLIFYLSKKTSYCEKALKKAQRKNEHIGKYIVPLNPYGKRGALYLAMGIIMPLAVCVATSILFSSPEAAFLMQTEEWLKPLKVRGI